jgi:hypothetical protein
MEDIPREISGELRKRIRAGLLRVHSKRLERTADLKTCLRECYDVYATLLRDAGWPLTEMLLTEFLPAWVYQWGVAKEWFPYPPNYSGPKQVLGSYQIVSIEEWRDDPFEAPRIPSQFEASRIPSQHVPIPEPLLKVHSGCDRAPDWYKEVTLKALASRISWWQAEVLDAAVVLLPKSIPEEGTTLTEGSSDDAEPKATTNEACVAETRADEPNRASEAVGNGTKRGAGPAPVCSDPAQIRRAKTRSAWLDRMTEQLKWTSDLDIQAHGGPNYNTIRRYRSGKSSTRDPYVRRELAKAFRCAIEEVPK